MWALIFGSSAKNKSIFYHRIYRHIHIDTHTRRNYYHHAILACGTLCLLHTTLDLSGSIWHPTKWTRYSEQSSVFSCKLISSLFFSISFLQDILSISLLLSYKPKWTASKRKRWAQYIARDDTHTYTGLHVCCFDFLIFPSRYMWMYVCELLPHFLPPNLISLKY